MRKMLRYVTALSSVLIVSACGSANGAITAPPGVARTACGSVTVAINPWVGYEANAAVVNYLMKTELGCQVVEKDLTEVQAWEGIANGSVDVILENWGHDDLKKKYIDDRKVAVEQGLTGNKGILGWWVPPWMAEEHPDIKDYKNLNEYADDFKTGKSGDKGQFLAGDPSFVTNDEALIKNLKLDYKVVYAGSEDALIAAFRKAEKEKQPLIGYFYSPQWFLAETPLVNIKLPIYKPGCDADAKKVACDYQPYDLDKIARKAFVDSGSPAADLVKNFRWTDDDQNQVARDLTVGKLSRDAAAKKWLDDNRAVWEKWIPKR